MHFTWCRVLDQTPARRPLVAHRLRAYNPGVALLISILAFVAAGCGAVLAWRASRAAHRLALEMVHLRDRLAQAEARYRDGAHAVVRTPTGPATIDPSVTRRLAALEARVRAATERPAGASADTEQDATELIRRRLLRDGYTRVSLLDTGADGRVLLEAERDGVTRKGRAALNADGSVAWQPVSTLRAFP
jgi:hypothetical protein